MNHRHPIEAIGSVAGQPTSLPPPQNLSDLAAPAGTQAQTTLTRENPQTTESPQTTGPTQPTEASLQKQLEAALKSTGYKAEITTESGGYTILKIVESETGEVILQMPSQTALAIVAAMQKSPQSGTAAVPSGTVFSELA